MEMIPNYNTMLFCQVWDNANDFYADVNSSGLTTDMKEANLKKLFYLLYARYANNPIANLDVNQFKYKVYSIIFQYGPTWEKRLTIQEELRALTAEEIQTGSKSINNRALNPSAEPTANSAVELEYINEQATTTYKRGKIDAYAALWDMLRTDVTEEFLKRFMKCFKLVVRPENPLLYISEGGKDNE